jgi:hypothetical protein
MKPQNTLKGLLIVVMLVLNTAFGFSQSICDQDDSYLNHFQYSIPSFIQLYVGGFCVPASSISDTTIYMKFYPEGKNGIIYWGYSSPYGYALHVDSVKIYDSSCKLISTEQGISDLSNSLYYVKFVIRTQYIDNFCPYFLPSNPLMVNFGMVKLEKIQTHIQVDWITLSEVNSNYFVIQYSYDLNSWKETVSVPSSQNSSTNKYYTANFTPQYSGMVYVRIAEHDLNGNTIYSDPEYIHFDFEGQNSSIYDLAGRLIRY